MNVVKNVENSYSSSENGNSNYLFYVYLIKIPTIINIF